MALSIRKGLVAVALSLGAASATSGALPVTAATEAHAASCSTSAPFVARAGGAAWGVGSGYCSSGRTCVSVVLYRNGAVAARGSRCGQGRVQASTSWIRTTFGDRLAVRSTVTAGL